MRALLARRVDIAWVLLIAALSGGVLVLRLAMQSGATPGGSVYIVNAAATSVAGQGGVPEGRVVEVASPTAVQGMTTLTPEPAAPDVAVYITGAVSAPGVYTLPAGSRLDAAIQAAGGISPAADLDTLNLAQHVQDGDRIVLPLRATVEPPGSGASTPEEATRVIQPTAYPTTPTLAVGSRLDINRATAQELEALPGIGPVLANRIVQDREANGPFATVDDLDRVNGIGEGIVSKVREHVTAGR